MKSLEYICSQRRLGGAPDKRIQLRVNGYLLRYQHPGRLTIEDSIPRRLGIWFPSAEKDYYINLENVDEMIDEVKGLYGEIFNRVISRHTPKGWLKKKEKRDPMKVLKEEALSISRSSLENVRYLAVAMLIAGVKGFWEYVDHLGRRSRKRRNPKRRAA